jgi:hypothetical protein
MDKHWYCVACRSGGWTIGRWTADEVSWFRRHNCKCEGPFPIRDIARLACGLRLSRHHILETLHGDDLTHCLVRYGMKYWPAWWLARTVDERTAAERTVAAS